MSLQDKSRGSQVMQRQDIGVVFLRNKRETDYFILIEFTLISVPLKDTVFLLLPTTEMLRVRETGLYGLSGTEGSQPAGGEMRSGERSTLSFTPHIAPGGVGGLR